MCSYQNVVWPNYREFSSKDTSMGSGGNFCGTLHSAYRVVWKRESARNIYVARDSEDTLEGPKMIVAIAVAFPVRIPAFPYARDDVILWNFGSQLK